MSESNGSNTRYFHSDWSNKVYAKLTDVTPLYDEIRKYTNLLLTDIAFLVSDGNTKKVNDTMRALGIIGHSVPDTDSYIGCSKCDERDQFDLEKGKKIASLKADMKYHDHREREYAVLINGLVNVITKLTNLRANHIRAYNKLYDKLISDYGWKEKEEL